MKVGTLLISELYSMLKSKHFEIAVQHNKYDTDKKHGNIMGTINSHIVRNVQSFCKCDAISCAEGSSENRF